MQDYNFDIIPCRRATGSYKWDSTESDNVIPLWVADMDFPTAPCIIEALQRRVEHGVFGYTKVRSKYYEALTGWFAQRHGWHFSAEDVIYTSGVVPALSAIIKGLTRPDDGVIVQTPAYNCFFSSIRNNGCRLIANELTYCSEDGSYSMNFDHLEQCAADPSAKLMILCNPHNPTGRVWTSEELRKVAEICHRHGVRIIADEIHCELTLGNFRYTPFAPIAEEVGTSWVVTNSPSKAFNTAGLQIANIITPDAELRQRIDRAINDNEVCDVNPFGVEALIAAYTQGAPWLDALREYLHANYQYACNVFNANAPQHIITPLEGTYLMWVNISNTGMDSDTLATLLEREARVKVSPGSIYGQGGEQFIRINLATSRQTLEDGLKHLVSELREISFRQQMMQ